MNDKENIISVARAIIRIGDAAEKAKDYGLLKSLEEMVSQLARHNVKDAEVDIQLLLEYVKSLNDCEYCRASNGEMSTADLVNEINRQLARLSQEQVDNSSKSALEFEPTVYLVTANYAKDENGNLLDDEYRLTSFGKKLRSTSLDELPELYNILKGDMSIVGPRPLLVKYLPLYNDEQKRRHDVRPGLTGLAQVSGRNAITWTEKFNKDIEYVDNVSLGLDISIFFKTIYCVLKKEGINSDSAATMEDFTGNN